MYEFMSLEQIAKLERANKIARDMEFKARKVNRKGKKHQHVNHAGNKGNRRAQWIFEADSEE